MDESKTIYQKQMSRIAKNGKASVDKNMPPMCGQLKWANELKAKKKSIFQMFLIYFLMFYPLDILKPKTKTKKYWCR